MGLCVGLLMVRYPLQEQAQALASGSWGVVGEIVRREKPLAFSGCNSTALQSAPDSCSAGPAGEVLTVTTTIVD